jgi:tellurite methyltransferase
MDNLHNSHEWKTVWDKIYAEGGYDMAPDEKLVQLSGKIPKGKVLDVGAGEGRHTLWLASQGFTVDAIDISSEGIRRLEHQAERFGLEVNCVIGSAADHDFGKEEYDLVLSTGSALNFFEKTQAKQVIERMKSAVKPKGYIYITLSTVDDPSYQRHRQRAKHVEDDSFFSEEMGCWVAAFRSGELPMLFPDFHILSYEEKPVHDTHGRPHTHMMAFLVAKRVLGAQRYNRKTDEKF